MKNLRLIVAASLLISGCHKAAQAPALHDFGVTSVAAAPNRQEPASAEITVVSPKWLSDNRIRYRLLYNQPTRVRFYNLDLWIAPPPELLKLHLTSANLDPRYSLVIHLLNFEQHFEAPGNASVLLHFSAEVFAADSRNRLERREFVLRSRTVNPDAQGAVDGFAELAEQASRQIQAWLRNPAKP